MLVLIGPQWLTARDQHNKRCIKDPADRVRQEIATAMRRNVRLIPVLLSGALMPAREALPVQIKALARCQALTLSQEHFATDIRPLFKAIRHDPVMAAVHFTPPPSSRNAQRVAMGAAIAAGLSVVTLGAYVLNTERSHSELKPQQLLDAFPTAAGFTTMAVNLALGMPDLSGIWRRDNGELYALQQNGRHFRIEVRLNEERIGAGSGELQGSTLSARLDVPSKGAGANIECLLQASHDAQSLTGKCQNALGVGPAFLLRQAPVTAINRP